MYDFVPRIDSSATDVSAASRVVAPVSPVQPAASLAGSASDAGVGADSGAEARRQHMASAADYARVHARISQILAEMDSALSSIPSQQMAASQMDGMLPQSTVIVPLPPATSESMERAIQIAQNMARQAALARSSHSGINSGTVSQILAEG